MNTILSVLDKVKTVLLFVSAIARLRSSAIDTKAFRYCCSDNVEHQWLQAGCEGSPDTQLHGRQCLPQQVAHYRRREAVTGDSKASRGVSAEVSTAASAAWTTSSFGCLQYRSTAADPTRPDHTLNDPTATQTVREIGTTRPRQHGRVMSGQEFLLHFQ